MMCLLRLPALGSGWPRCHPSRYVHPEIVDNVAEVNFGNTADHRYSREYKSRLAACPRRRKHASAMITPIART